MACRMTEHILKAERCTSLRRLSMLVQRVLDAINRELAAKEDELQRAKAALKAAQV